MYLSLIYILKDLEETLVHLLTLVVLGLRCCARFRLAAASAGLRFGSRVRFRVAAASLLAERRRWGAGASGVAAMGSVGWFLGSGAQAQS